MTATPEEQCSALFHAMIERFRETPSPEPVALREVARGLAAAEAAGVLYGWDVWVFRADPGLTLTGPLF
jgi:hypothetical protein